MSSSRVSPPPDPRAYWRARVRLTAVLLAIWFLVGPVLGILLVEPLNRMSIGGMPLGFWISQQGAIYVFVVLIFVYAALSDRADREAGLQPDAPTTAPPAH